MKKTGDRDRKRAEWLKYARELTCRRLERRALLKAIFPEYRHADLMRHIAIEAAIRMDREVEFMLGEMARLESPTLGAKALLGRNATALERSVVAAMVVQRLSRDAGDGRIGDLLDLIGGREGSVHLALRCLFREDSRLRPHLHILHAETLDASTAVLTERAFNRCMGLRPDSSEHITASLCATGQWTAKRPGDEENRRAELEARRTT